MLLERFSLDCRIGIGFGFGFGLTTSFGWLVYLLWFWFYDSQVKTALLQPINTGANNALNHLINQETEEEDKCVHVARVKLRKAY